MAYKVTKWCVGLVVFMWATTWAANLVSLPDNWSVVFGVLTFIVCGVIAANTASKVVKTAHAQLKQRGMLVLLLGLGALATTGCGATTIEPGHAGIVVNSWGTNRGVQDYTVSTGRVIYNPFTTQVFQWPTYVQSVVWTKDPAEGHPANEEITFTNKDQMQIAADVSLAYHLDQSKLPAFYVKFRTDNMATFTHGYLRSLTRDKFNELAGHYTIADIMGDNGTFLAEVRAALQKDLEPFGVVLETQFGIIGAPRPPVNVIEAINQQAVAQRLALTKENELRQVRADVAKTVAKAEGDARATAVWSEAQAAANKRLSESLTANLIELKRLEKWNGVLPQVSGGATPFVNMVK